MTKLIKFIGIIILLSIVIPLASMSNSNASGFNSILMGEYVFSQTMSCAVGPIGVGFNSDLSRSANGDFYTIFVQGIVNFNGDGTGNSAFTVLQIRPTQNSIGQYPVRQFSGLGTLSYTVNQDKTFTVESQATVKTIVGPVLDSTSTITGVFLDGLIVQGNQLLSISDLEPNIEIITLENGDTLERICGRSQTAMRKKMIE